jgi:uncharacterized membrane protein
MEENPNTRLLALSDGVIAVAITLLVLDIRLPEGFGEFSDAELGAALVALWPRMLAYLLSFLVIGSFWFSHRAKFDHIAKTDGGLMRINMLFLLTICLVPFTTNLIAENGGTLATAVYAATMVVSGLSLTWLWAHAWRHGLLSDDTTKDDRMRQLSSTLLVSAVFGVSIPLSVAHADIAKYFWILIAPVNLLMRLVSMWRWRRAHPGEPYPRRRREADGD